MICGGAQEAYSWCAALADLTRQALVYWPQIFGVVERENMSSREASTVGGYPILRFGNIKDVAGKPRATFAKVPALTSDADVRYNATERRP